MNRNYQMMPGGISGSSTWFDEQTHNADFSLSYSDRQDIPVQSFQSNLDSNQRPHMGVSSVEQHQQHFFVEPNVEFTQKPSFDMVPSGQNDYKQPVMLNSHIAPFQPNVEFNQRPPLNLPPSGQNDSKLPFMPRSHTESFQSNVEFNQRPPLNMPPFGHFHNNHPTVPKSHIELFRPQLEPIRSPLSVRPDASAIRHMRPIQHGNMPLDNTLRHMNPVPHPIQMNNSSGISHTNIFPNEFSSLSRINTSGNFSQTGHFNDNVPSMPYHSRISENVRPHFNNIPTRCTVPQRMTKDNQSQNMPNLLQNNHLVVVSSPKMHHETRFVTQSNYTMPPAITNEQQLLRVEPQSTKLSQINEHRSPSSASPAEIIIPNHSVKRSTAPGSFFAVAPPYLPSREESIEDADKNADKLWLNGFLENTNKNTQNQPTTTTGSPIISISSYQKVMKQALDLKNQLTETLECIKQESDKQRIIACNKEAENLSNELRHLTDTISNEKTILRIKKLIERRRKKRERLKRGRRNLYQHDLDESLKQDTKHKLIDAQLHTLSESFLVAKQKKEFKDHTDKVKSEVMKKLTDTDKTIELLNAIHKLRNVRLHSIVSRGINANMPLHENFEAKIAELLKVLENQKAVYVAEAKTLEVMLDKEEEDIKVEELEKKKSEEEDRCKRLEKQVNRRLFGEEKPIEEKLTAYYNYYNQAASSLENLINIRREWDSYLVAPYTPGATRMPDGWLQPIEPSTNTWQKYVSSS